LGADRHKSPVRSARSPHRYGGFSNAGSQYRGREIERVLEKKLSTLSGEDYVAAGGVESIAKILNHVDSDSRDQITEAITSEDPELAYTINEAIAPKK